MRTFLSSLVCLIAGICIGYFLLNPKEDITPICDVTEAVITDSIRYDDPKPEVEKNVGTKVVRLSLASSSKPKSSKPVWTDQPQCPNVVEENVEADHPPDSVEVVVPIVQKVYSDSTYRAYVSGFNPSLDSIFVYRTTKYVTITKTQQAKPKLFSVGVQAGYGMTPRGFQPYIGLGIGISLISF